MNRAPLTLSLCFALLTTHALGQVSSQHRDWGETAVHLLMTKQETADWDALKNDDGATAFIELFWARRDPTPDTAVNELRMQLEARMATADKRYGSGKTPGSQSDCGVVYVLLGEPTQIVNGVTKYSASPSATPQFQRPINVQTWIYRQNDAERAAGTKAFDLAFVFNDEKYATAYELDGPSRHAFESIALEIAKSVLKRPFLTAAQPAKIAAIGLIVVSDSSLANDLLRRAQEGENFAALARKYSSHPSAPQGGYLGRFAFDDLDDDFRSALTAKGPGSTVLIARKPQFAIVRLLTDAEVAAAEAEIPKR